MSQRYFIFTRKHIPLFYLENNGKMNLTITYTTFLKRLILVDY